MRPSGRASAAIFGLALGIRLLHLWHASGAPFFGLKIVDAVAYDAWARRIAEGQWIGDGVFYQAPLYPYFLGLVYGVVGDGPLPLLVLQSLIGASACVLLASAGARFFSDRVGIAAGLLLAVYTPAVFFDTIVQKTVLDLFLVCLLLRTLSDTRDWPSRTSFLGAGAVLGALVLNRENALALIPALLCWIVVQRGWAARERLGLAAALFVGLAIVLTPVAVRNLVLGGEFHLTTSQLGPNLYIGNNPGATGGYTPLVEGRGHPRYERVDATRLAGDALGRALSPGEVSRYWVGRAVAYVAEDPAGWLGLMARKFALIWNATETVDAEDPYTYAEWSIPLRWGGWLFNFGILAPLAFLGMGVTWQQRSQHSLLYLLIGTYLASVLLFFVFARYRLPVVPLLALFAGAGVVRLRACFVAASSAKRVRLLTATVVVAAFSNWPLSNRDYIRAFTHYNFGQALTREGRLQEAISEHRHSVALNPRVARFHNRLGQVLVQAGDNDAGAQAFRAALALDHDYAEAHYHLASTLIAQQDLEAAALPLEQAIRIKPGFARALHDLGVLRARQARLEEALALLERAVAASPGFNSALLNLERVKASLGTR